MDTDAIQRFSPREMESMIQISPRDFEEGSKEITNEKSRIVRCCMIKYKCVLMITFIFLQFCYIVFRDVLAEDDLKDKLLELLEKITTVRNNTI